MASKSTTAENPAEMSKKDLDAKRKEITKYYEGNIPHLETQLRYEELLRDIEKTRAERLQAQMFIAQTMAEPPSEENVNSEKDIEKNFDVNKVDGAAAAQEIKRTLKRQNNEV